MDVGMGLSEVFNKGKRKSLASYEGKLGSFGGAALGVELLF